MNLSEWVGRWGRSGGIVGGKTGSKIDCMKNLNNNNQTGLL